MFQGGGCAETARRGVGDLQSAAGGGVFEEVGAAREACHFLVEGF